MSTTTVEEEEEAQQVRGRCGFLFKYSNEQIKDVKNFEYPLCMTKDRHERQQQILTRMVRESPGPPDQCWFEMNYERRVLQWRSLSSSLILISGEFPFQEVRNISIVDTCQTLILFGATRQLMLRCPSREDQDLWMQSFEEMIFHMGKPPEASECQAFEIQQAIVSIVPRQEIRTA